MNEIEFGDYTCIIKNSDGNDVFKSRKRGVAPLLELLDCGTDVKDCAAFDKVVGRGAAFLYVRLNVKSVYALVMSERAKSVLERGGISSECSLLVKNIVNRAGDGICPMEQATADIDDPVQAERAIRNKLLSLNGGK